MGLFADGSGRLSLEPIFGPKTFGADTTCLDIHPGGPIPEGDRVCCMKCYQTGVEGHAELRETASGRLRLQNWTPDGGRDPWSTRDSAAQEPTRYEGAGEAETRKQRRKREFAHRTVYVDPAHLGRLLDRGRAVPSGRIEA